MLEEEDDEADARRARGSRGEDAGGEREERTFTFTLTFSLWRNQFHHAIIRAASQLRLPSFSLSPSLH